MAHPDQRFGDRTHGQHGEDIVVVAVFDLIQPGVAPTFLDVGCHHPRNINNTILLYERGSVGVNVDANHEMIAMYADQRPKDVSVCVAVGAEPGKKELLLFDRHSGRNTLSEGEALAFEREAPGFRVRDRRVVEVVTLDHLFDTYFPARAPDFLSVDAEGMDHDIVFASQHLRDPNGPKVVCVETRVRDGLRMASTMGYKGYFPLIRMGENLVFVRRDLRDTVMGMA